MGRASGGHPVSVRAIHNLPRSENQKRPVGRLPSRKKPRTKTLNKPQNKASLKAFHNRITSTGVGPKSARHFEIMHDAGAWGSRGFEQTINGQ